MKSLHMIACILLWVGGINWGLIGLFNFNLVAWLGLSMMLTNLIYMLVGASAVLIMLTHKKDCTICSKM